MQLLNQKLKIDFMAGRKLAMIFSILLVLTSLGSLATRGLELGIDFTGGTLIEVGYPVPADITKVRAILSDAGFADAVVQNFGTSKELLIRIAPKEGVKSSELSSSVLAALQADEPKIDMRRVEFVGPQVGDELTEDGGLAVIFSLITILLYVSMRFEYRFAIGSVAALAHDVTITLGVFSLLQIEFDLPVLAAILAVIGYSLNDTIVVFDRIRENFRKLRKGTAVEITNISLNQTLARTVMTSLTTMLVLLSLFFLGGEIIHGFATALVIGVVVGTYSSIYVASSTIISLGISKEDLLIPEKEGVDQDETP